MHSQSRPGALTPIKSVASCFTWKDLTKHVRAWSDCNFCQRVKVHWCPKAPIDAFEHPHAGFDHLHISIVVPRPTLRGCRHLFWPLVRYPSYIRHFRHDLGFDIHTLMSLSLRCPNRLRFYSYTLCRLCEFLGCAHLSTTRKHPVANDTAKRFYRQLKVALRAFEPVLVISGVRDIFWREYAASQVRSLPQSPCQDRLV